MGGAVIPLVAPGIVAAITLRRFIRTLGLKPGLTSVTLGHAVPVAPCVTLIVGETQAFVTLPHLRPAMLGSLELPMLLSFDDFLRAFFLGGSRATLPPAYRRIKDVRAIRSNSPEGLRFADPRYGTKAGKTCFRFSHRSPSTCSIMRSKTPF